MKLRTALLAALAVAASSSVALAQKDKPVKPDGVPVKPDPDDAEDPDMGGEADEDGAGGTEVELEDDPPPDDMEGTAENPDAPRLGDEGAKPTLMVPKAKRTGYPIEELLRPLTLPAVTSELGLDLAFTADPADVEFGLRARYGITRQWQLGLRYLIGGVYKDLTGSDSTGFSTGKAFGLDVSYLVFDWMAAKITVPVYVDPVAVAVTFGAPMKFKIGKKDKLAIIAGDDFLDIKIATFIPSLTHERSNEALVIADMANDVTTRASVHLRGGVIVQMSPKLAIKGQFTQSFPIGTGGSTAGTGTINESPTGLEGFVQFSPSGRFDLVGRAGFNALDDAGSFGITVGAAFRI